MDAKELLRDWMSPGMIRSAKRVLDHLRPPPWEYVPEGWRKPVRGWDEGSVVEAQVQKWSEFRQLLQGTGPLGVAHEARHLTAQDYAAHNTLMVFAYVLARSARGQSRLSILDWGGGLGHYYLVSRALLPELELDYHCKDLPLVCERGRTLLPEVTFHDSAESCAGRAYDLVFSSSSLHYSENWREVVKQLAALTASSLYLTRLPIVRHAPSFVVMQRPYSVGYRTEYLGWFLNRAELLGAARDSGMELLREFLIDERPLVHRAPEQGEYRGFLLRPAQRAA